MFELPLGATASIDKWSITRVPGGWIYQPYLIESAPCVFVPEPPPTVCISQSEITKEDWNELSNTFGGKIP